MNSLYKAARLAAIAAIFALLSLLLIACGKEVTVSFYTDEISMYVGETRDLAPYIAVRPISDAAVTLEADGDCVSLDGTRVTATAAGVATVTANAGEARATLKINAEYRKPNGIYVTTGGDTVQSVAENAKPKKVSFTATLDDYADPEAEIVWTVNGDECGKGSSFDFTPPSYGEYAVAASAAGASCTHTVAIYRPTVARAYYEGKLEQDNDYSSVRFFAAESIDSRNPKSVFSWTVNGVEASLAQVFYFTPSARGEYEVSLKVNGASARFDGPQPIARLACTAWISTMQTACSCGGATGSARVAYPLRTRTGRGMYTSLPTHSTRIGSAAVTSTRPI